MLCGCLFVCLSGCVVWVFVCLFEWVCCVGVCLFEWVSCVGVCSSQQQGILSGRFRLYLGTCLCTMEHRTPPGSIGS